MAENSREGRREQRRSQRQERREGRRQERGRKRKRKRRDDGDRAPAEDPLAAAHRRADAKARVVRDVLEYVVVVGVLALFLRPLAWVVGIVWGLHIGSRFVKHVVEPELRQRWIEREVRRELGHEVSAHRREVEGAQARHIEQLAAGVAHEIRNPITAAKSLVQQMGEDPSSVENVEYANVALEELNRVEKSISHLLRFAREEGVRLQEMRMAEVVASAVDGCREQCDRVGAEIKTVIDSDGEMRGDPEKLRRVLVNLIANALDALAASGQPRPWIEIQSGANLAGSAVWVRLRDNGPGIPEERLSKIWSPFYTSKEHGTGLGLALTRKIVEAHGGHIEAARSPEGGTEFIVTLPRDAIDGAEASR